MTDERGTTIQTFLNGTLIVNQYLNTMPPFFSSLGPPTEEEANSADITFCNALGRPENRGSLNALREEYSRYWIWSMVILLDGNYQLQVTFDLVSL